MSKAASNAIQPVKLALQLVVLLFEKGFIFQQDCDPKHTAYIYLDEKTHTLFIRNIDL